MNMPYPMPSRAHLLETFSYEPETGSLIWRARPPEKFKAKRAASAFKTRCEGKPAGDIRPDGYARVIVCGHRYLAHRIIYKMMTGEEPKIIDHINGVRSDNRWRNLRVLTHIENTQSRSVNKNSRTGVNGVTLTRGRYHAYICAGRRLKHLGFFDTLDEAAAARKSAEIRIGYKARPEAVQ